MTFASALMLAADFGASDRNAKRAGEILGFFVR
jgi:hypothetical protein